MHNVIPVCMLLAVTMLVSVSTPLAAQNSLSEQRAKCNSLRDKVQRARQDLDLQLSRAEGRAKTEELVVSAMRQKGRTEAEIARYRAAQDSIQATGGSLSAAQRAYRAAREDFDLQGCAGSGIATYNYEITE